MTLSVKAVKGLVETELETVKPGKEFKLKVIGPDTLSIGRFKDTIEVDYEGDENGSERINVFGNVHDLIIVSPELIRLTENPEGEVARQIFIRKGGAANLKVLEATWPGTNYEIELVDQQPRGFLLKIEGIAPTQDLNKKPIMIKTNVKGKEHISIPVVVTAP